jgi:hypothetical protein
MEQHRHPTPRALNDTRMADLCESCAAWLLEEEARAAGALRWFYGGTPPPEPARPERASLADGRGSLATLAA